MILSRLSLIGGIDQNTPKVVITEIIRSHQVESLDQLKPIFIALPPEDDQWSDIAQYVNDQVEWSYQTLVPAFNFLTEFEDFTADSPLPDLTVIGPQTPIHPTSLNACVLYKILKVHQIETKPDQTLDQLASLVRWLNLPREIIISELRTSLLEQTKIDLINLLAQVKSITRVRQDYDHQTFSLLHSRLTDTAGLQTLIDPTTNDGAIALSAILYKIDISSSVEPIKEYQQLKISDRYCPFDPEFRLRYNRRPDFFSLRKNFQPILPPDYYSKTDLEKIARYLGVSSTGDLYENLQVHYLSNTFYRGIVPEITASRTAIDWEEINESPSIFFFSYGKIGDKIYPISINELKDWFERNNNLSDPFIPGSCISIPALETLKALIVNILNQQTDHSEIFRQTYELITTIQGDTTEQDQATKRFIADYRRADFEQKRTIRHILQLLLEVAMYMRGWLGPEHPYPIDRKSTDDEPKDQAAIDIRTTCALNTYQDFGDQFGINSLPLVSYKDGYYLISNDPTEGFTIAERIKIVYDGMISKNINSCIRLSSNWLAASAHKYLTAIGQPPPFNINKLIKVS